MVFNSVWVNWDRWNHFRSNPIEIPAITLNIKYTKYMSQYDLIRSNICLQPPLAPDERVKRGVMCHHGNDVMNPFFESFQKETGKRLSQIAIGILLLPLLTLAISLLENMKLLTLISICTLLLLSIALASGLLFRYFSCRKPKNRVEPLKIDNETCEWINDPPVWKHRTNGLYYCPHCAPNPSPLSSDYFCLKCSQGFGPGEVFTVDW